MKKARTVKVSRIFILVVVFLFAAIIVKLFYVALSPKVDGIDLTEFASNRNTVKETIVAERGTIYDSLNNVLAINVNSYTVYAVLSDKWTTDPKNPQHVVDKGKTAKELAPLINMSEERILELLNTKDVYQVELGPGGRGITELLKETIENLNLPGIGFSKSVKRYYPNGNFLSYTLGYAKTDEEDGEIKGEMGLELAYNKELTGKNGSREYQSDIYGYKIANTKENVKPATNGKDIYLTIDTNIQMFTEQAIKKLETASYLEWATITVANAKTGEILGVASNPSFDPNTKEITNYYDPFVSYTYEPGSTMKTFSFMAAIENNLYNGDELYDSGYINIGEYTIRDWNVWGWGKITFDQGFYGSSNVAATLLSQRLGKNKLKDFYTKLGYGKKVGIGLPNEQDGELNFKYDIEVANASFGQGMTVTPVQMIQALTAISNDGIILKPYIIKKIVDPETGEVELENKRTEVRRVASSETIKKIQKMLYGVVNSDEIMASGTAYKTDIVTTMGKTGTAQIASPDGGYLTGYTDYVRSFEGLFPYEDPQIIVYAAVSKLSDQNLISDAVKVLIEDVSTYLGIVNNEVKQTYEPVTVDSYINKDTQKTNELLKDKNINVITIGDGNKIIKQYPSDGSKLNPNDKLFLLTNSTNLAYTNLTNWSRNDLIEYGKLLGINFNITGYGYVTNLDLTGRNVIKGETIDVTLAPKYGVSSPNST